MGPTLSSHPTKALLEAFERFEEIKPSFMLVLLWQVILDIYSIRRKCPPQRQYIPNCHITFPIQRYILG